MIGGLPPSVGQAIAAEIVFLLQVIIGGILLVAALSLGMWLASRRAPPRWRRPLQWSAAGSGLIAGIAAGCFALFLATLR